MKYIFVGDIHGKVDEVEAALAKEGKKIFVGDFIDSYDRSVEDHKKCFDLVFDAIDKGEAEALFGNHELSYILPFTHGCSGKSAERMMLMRHYGPICIKKFKPFLFLAPNFLVSHAGLTTQMWESEGLTLETVEGKLNEWWPNESKPIHNIGYYRGGGKPYGGLFWCDFNAEFEPVTGLNQVFGHTRASQGQGIRHIKMDTESSYCIDVLDFHKNTFLELEL